MKDSLAAYLSKEEFCVQGDGKTDDTEVIKMAIEQYETIYLPQGWYVVTDTIKCSPAVWVKTFGNGRVVYLAPGHDINSFKNDSFRSLIRNSALWVVG